MTSETLDKMWNILKENDFQIDVSINSDLLCTSCKRVMIQPRIVPCGCRYCYNCLLSYLNDDEEFCSGESHYCKSELINFDRNVFIDQPASIKISKIIVKCPLESCEFNTELGKMADHMRICDRQPVTCPYYAIGCYENKFDVDKMRLHFKQENFWHARLLMEFLVNWKSEVNLLKSTMLDLQKENKWIQKQMESEQKKTSALEENVGKVLYESRSLNKLETEKIHEVNQIKEMVLKMERNSKEHKEEMEKNKVKLKEMEISQEHMRTKIEKIGAENKSLREELKNIKLISKMKEEEISALQAISKVTEQELCKGKENGEFLQKSQEQVKTRIDKISQENLTMSAKFKERENETKILETKLTQVQANQNWGEFVWCIENWEEKRERARNGIERYIFSRPFFSHKNGYKMCLRLDPGGNGSGKGIHLASFVCIMRGEFDNILQWPFRHVIKLELMNQKTGLAHASKIVDSKNSPDCENWKKPDKERNVGFGYDDFIELSELVLNSALCRGNQIWIRATPQLTS